MVIMGGVDVVEGDKLEILGRTYILGLDHSLAGDFVVWSDENSFMMVYATPNFDGMIGVPIQLDYEWCTICGDSYDGNIDSYDHYKQIVKEMVEKMLKNLPRCKCTYEVDLESHPPIDVKGWEFDLCGYCHKLIGKGESVRKDRKDGNDISIVDCNLGELKMKTIGDVDVLVGDKLEILEKTYVLHIEDELFGEYVVWIDEKSFMRIYATPNFEIDGVAIKVDYDCYNIATDVFHGKIRSYDHYKQIVKEMVENMLVHLPECKCLLGKEVGTCVPINVEGANFYICTHCSGTLGKD
jgi:predicted nucleic acid-binding Zn ribbon protein